MSLLTVLLCLYRIGVPLAHTTYLYAIHPSKYNFLAFQIAALCIGVVVSAAAVTMFWTSVRKHLHNEKQLKEYEGWVHRNMYEKAVRDPKP